MSAKKLVENQEDELKLSTGRRLKELREHFGLRQAEFIRPWKGKIGTYSSVETGKNGVSEQLLRLLWNHYNVNPLWLLTGEGDMLIQRDSSSEAAEPVAPYSGLAKVGPGIITVTVDSAGNENITQVSNKARGGYVAGGFLKPEYLQDLPAFSLPGSRFRNGTFRAFEVAGDSMQSTCYPGDLIIAQKLYNWATEIREGYVHIIVTRDDILVKRVLNRLIENGNLVLKSDNINYPTQLIEGDEVLEVWLAKAKLSSQFINSRYDSAREQLQTQANLAELAAEFDDFKQAVADKLGLPARELGRKKVKK